MLPLNVFYSREFDFFLFHLFSSQESVQQTRKLYFGVTFLVLSILKGIANLEGISGGGGGVNLNPPLDSFGLKFLFLDWLPKALTQLFFVC